ncbi:creatininase family protein [Streptomyces sp. NPDC057620]|uniref:Creatininase family protein n=1 Tax=Streptomyces liliiviolaceus TaxID=2823109 RepID=A0A941B8R8_9ACTN|nr:creatininase family protein [Streptomyces liliiviolaceus]MBQ0849298.1 creatininase family protein [Streptomyces liliiviolaceus]
MNDDSTRMWADLTTEDVAGLAKDRTVVVQPIGAVEQHGAHLPLITDALTAETIARTAVRRLGPDSGTWVLPTLHYGKSTEHLGRAGTIAMSTNTLLSVCLDLGESLAAGGVRKLVFVNGHGGQPSLLDVVSRDIRHRFGLEVFSIMPSRFALPDTVEDPDPFGIHGGFLETSLVMAIAPELVKQDKAVADGLTVGAFYRAQKHLTLEGVVPTAWLIDDVSASGVVGDPTGANADTGRLLLEHWSGLLAEALTEVRDFAFPALGGTTAA